MAATQRIRQGIRALLAFSQPVDMPLASRYLSTKELALFSRMRRPEQLHSLNVLRDVLAQGGSAPDALIVACLLHDVGKSRYPTGTVQKTFSVLVRALLPNLFQRWSKGNPQNLLHRAFVVHVQHPAWSAELLTEAGSSQAAIWLVAHHQDSSDEWTEHAYFPLLERLQAADDAN